MSLAVIHPLDHLGLIRVSGADARAFLQGQLSNDINLVTPVQTQLSSYSNPKGRVLAVLRIFACDDALYLQLPRDLLADTLTRLQLYVLRAKVTLADASTDLPGLGVSGAAAEAWLQNTGLPVPATIDAAAAFANGCVFRVAGAEPRFIVYATPEILTTCQQTPHHAGNSTDWQLLDIRAGLPTVYPQTRELFIAQMLNLDTLNAINFKKGCYTGQEIIARLHYRGTVKRRLYRAQGATPQPGTPIYTPSLEQSIGNAVDAVQDELLIVLQTDQQAAELRVGGSDGASIQLIAQTA